MGHRKPKQLNFEEYHSFFCNRHADNLTTNQLNQILFFHGVKQLRYKHGTRVAKGEIMVAVSSLNLIPPTRSLCDSSIQLPVATPTCSSVSLEGVRHDFREIGWEECPVGSILTINPAALAIEDLNSMPTNQKKIRGKVDRWNRNAENSALPSLFAKEDLKQLSGNRIAGEKTTLQVLAKNSKNADPYTWHSTGNMRIIGLPYRRRYYRCSEIGCVAKKHIDRDAKDPLMCIITYKGQHNHAIS